jgi:hypothetical protein
MQRQINKDTWKGLEKETDYVILVRLLVDWIYQLKVRPKRELDLMFIRSRLFHRVSSNVFQAASLWKSSARGFLPVT